MRCTTQQRAQSHPVTQCPSGCPARAATCLLALSLACCQALWCGQSLQPTTHAAQPRGRNCHLLSRLRSSIMPDPEQCWVVHKQAT